MTIRSTQDPRRNKNDRRTGSGDGTTTLRYNQDQTQDVDKPRDTTHLVILLGNTTTPGEKKVSHENE